MRAEGPAGFFIDKAGKVHSRVEGVAVTYLTPAGARLADMGGTTRAQLVVPGAEGERRVAVATGLLWRLWKTLRRNLAAARCRVAAVARRCTPYPYGYSQKKDSICSGGLGVVDNRPAAGSGEALAGLAVSESTHDANAPPSSAGTQAHAPPDSAEHAAEGTAPHTSRPGGDGVACPPVPERLVAGLPEALRETFAACWQHVARGPAYRQPNPRYAGGDALVPHGERRAWAPLTTAATAWPKRWARASPTERRWLEARFGPVRQALTVALLELERQRAAAGEAAAAEAARAATEHEQLLAEVEALERKRRAQPGAGAW